MRSLFDRFRNRSGLLLMLAAALVGFFLLINLLGTVTSSGPDDLLATAPSDDSNIRLPSGVGLLAFSLGAVGLVLGGAAAFGLVRLARQNTGAASKRYMVIGVLFGLLLAGGGLYLAFSGMLGQDIAYSEHQAQRGFVQPKGLLVLGAFLLSLILVGMVKPRLLLAHLAVWLVLSVIFGFFGSASLAGLNLFEESEEPLNTEAYAAEVEKYRNPRPEAAEALPWDAAIPLENGGSALARGSSLLLEPGTSAVPGTGSVPNPLFKIAGAANTSWLRSATGDVYENGEWIQVDPAALDTGVWSDIPREILDLIDAGIIDESLIEQGLEQFQRENRIIPDLLAQPSAVPDSLNIDHISVSPAEGFDTLEPGRLPMTDLPLGIREEGTWNPFSRTFTSEQPVSDYQWQSMAVEFSEEKLAKAEAVDDQAYLQLPEDLPQRVRDLATGVTAGIDSPYEKAKAIEQFLESEYSYSVPEPGQPPAQPPEGQDPVDWFLFDQRAGSSTSFSSAFTILSRAAGVPARVVSGWAIRPTAEEQTVYGHQSHQWAEIGLKEFGWIPFDPTPGKVLPTSSDDLEDGVSTEVSLPDPLSTDSPTGTSTNTGTSNDSESPVDPLDEESSFQEEVALQNLADSPDPNLRREAASLLGEIGSEQAIQGLAHSMFNDSDQSVRAESITSMASLETGELVDLLENHPDTLLRMAAAATLGHKGDAQALGPLANALVHTPDAEEEVRAAAASALGDLQLPEATDSLLNALASDSSGAVRGASAEALGEIGDPNVSPYLDETLKNDADEGVRESAADALGDLVNPSSLPQLLESRSDDPSHDVRSASGGAIDEFPQSSLTQALEEHPDSSVRQSAAQVLGERGDPSAADELAQALNDPDPDVRRAAGNSLENLGDVSRLENGSGLLSHSQGVSFIPGTTAEQASELPHTPVFQVETSGSVDFLRTAVGDQFENGIWSSNIQDKISYTKESPLTSAWPSQAVAAASTSTVQVQISPPEGEDRILAGTVPISSHPTRISISGIFYPDSETFASSNAVGSYDWTAAVPVFSAQQLNRAKVWSGYTHAALPDGMPERVQQLALRITAGNNSPYQMAKAIEQHLRTNYTYQLADPTRGGVPPGTDPIDWFLFESREGTCGNFSSAFVVLARAVGLPARVVSGWSISPAPGAATVYADQAHQRAEVAFEALGWIPFEPTPGSGAPGRAPEYASEEGPGSPEEQQEIEQLLRQLASDDPAEQASASQELESLGAEVDQAENGGAVVSKDGQALSLGAGTTTQQVQDPNRNGPPSPVFVVTGAANSKYLRSASGDIYQNGGWGQLDQISLDYDAGQSVPHLVRSELSRSGGGASILPQSLSSTGLLAGFDTKPLFALTDNIVLEASSQLGRLPPGLVPTSQFLDLADSDGVFRPISGTFAIDAPTPRLGWVSQVPVFSQEQLEGAVVVSDPAYTRLPASVPERVRDLALEVTQGHQSPYAKAKALESYLSDNYAYRFADGSGSEIPPAGRDPVDWFLFDHLEGTCGVFSTAFAVMARSIGIPARVASGWSISPTADRQEVMTDQAHQWGEVAFEGLGWVQFEPTASSGAPSRTALQREAESRPPMSEEEPEQQRQQQPEQQESREATEREVEESVRPARPLDTMSTISSWPSEVRRKTGFVVGGTLRTASGSPVSEMQVEIYINETKEHGGTKIGHTTARNGVFRTEVSLPSSMQRGNYQLLARAIGNDRYNESWSDPDITVYSESGLQLTGPNEVAVDTAAEFRGKLVDDTGSGVSSLELQVLIDDRKLPPQSTNAAGEFGFAQTFTEVGSHTVEVGFDGRDFLLGQTARLELTAVMPTELILSVLGKVEVGEEFLVEGILRNARGEPVAGAEVTIAVGPEPPWEAETLEDGTTIYTRVFPEGIFEESAVVTGDDGSFTAAGTAHAVGETLVRGTFAGQHPVMPSSRSTTVTARHLTEITISGPSSVLQEEEGIFEGRITSASLSELGALTIEITDRQGNPIQSLTTEDDGSFEYRSASGVDTGPRLVTARLDETELFTSSSASVSFNVVEPTVLSVSGPSLAPVGSTIELQGVLQTVEGSPVPGARVWVGDPGSEPLITGADGSFSRNFPMTASFGSDEIERAANITFGFDGNARRAPSQRSHAITVGVPWLSAEPAEPVARGEMASLRGTVMLGSYPIANAVVTAEPEGRTLSSETGSFTLNYPVAPETPLGRKEVSVSVSEMDLSAALPVNVKSAVKLVVVPLEDVHPGEQIPLQVTLYDDRGNGIPGALLRISQDTSPDASQDEEELTNNVGVALFTLTVPESDGQEVVPLTISYEGDDFHMAESYFVGIPVEPEGFNWLLWAALPALVVLLLTTGFAASRWSSIPLPAGMRLRLRRRAGGRETDESTPAMLTMEKEPEPESVPDPEPTMLTMAFIKPAPDLPNVWGVGEQVAIEINLSVADGRAVGQAPVTVLKSDEDPQVLTTGEMGDCSLSWIAESLGEFTITTGFEESDLHLASAEEVVFRVVDFREEIVRLYNEFVDWAETQVSRASSRTPRELESMLVGSGKPLNFRALDEVISRFEEADYSEHPIGRRQYESMYRSWSTFVEDQEEC